MIRFFSCFRVLLHFPSFLIRWFKLPRVKRAVLLEGGAAIIFFGSLIQHPEIERYGANALQELRLRGYEVPTSSDPVRVYPTNTTGSFSPFHAGGWRPGVISLRQNPLGSTTVDVALRHELMHEASLRTCKGKLALWAEEAAAMNFSGELSAQSGAGPPTAVELENLRKRVRIGARLDSENYRTLSKLVMSYAWPERPCVVSETIGKLIEPSGSSGETGFSCILVSLISGRILESQGDLHGKYPPGSLLKIPYAAALRDASPEALGKELVASDTAKLLNRRKSFDPERFYFLVSPVESSSFNQGILQEEMAGKDEGFWRPYLGERGVDGNFPLEASLQELAQLLRAALLYQPDYFSGLAENGFVEASTLYSESEQDKKVLGKLHAMSKTGTVSDERNNPLAGHLMVAWPAEDPEFLAVFRNVGSNGASNIRRASRILDEWVSLHPSEFGKVRVRLLELAPRSSWEILDECPSFEREDASGWKRRVSTCGRFRIVSSARGSRSERFVSGILMTSRDGRTVVLETDPESYADAVLSAEAQDLKGEAQKALRAVIVWNGAHGSTRHGESSSLCDTTHCMVFQGSLAGRRQDRGNSTDPNLLKLLDELASVKKLDWLPFSKGGSERWEKEIPVSELKKLVDEPSILDIRRERTRTGDIVVHLMYPENEEVVSCEFFRNRLKLLSCPEIIRCDESRSSWVFSGIGEGHGDGLSVEKARALARSGHNASAILADAYK
jgi:hypothetical protein